MTNFGSEILIEDQDEKEVWEKIDQLVKQQEVVAFVKGDSILPQCGFSARSMQILNLCQKPYKTVNVLKNGVVREAIKKYSDWPTIPQIYYKGEFLGGSDILMELYENGELQKKFDVRS